MKRFILAAALLAIAAPARAQTHYSIGIANCGKLATEVTARARCPSLPGSPYIAIGMDSHTKSHLSLTTRVMLVLGGLQVQECESTPCPEVPDLDWRPRDPNLFPLEEPFMLIIEGGIGLRVHLPFGFEVAGGPGITAITGSYKYFGANMAVCSMWAEARKEVEIAGLRLGAEAGISRVPPKCKGFTVISYATGYRVPGDGGWPNGWGDPQPITMKRLGVVVERSGDR